MTSRESPPAKGDAAGVDDPAIDGGHDGADGADELDRQPNYLIRRGIAIGGVVAAIAIGAVVVGSLIDGGSDDAPIGAAQAEWDTIVLLDERSGQVILTDPAGEEQARFASGVTNPSDALVVSSTLLVTASDAATVVDLSAESSQVVELELGTNGATMPSGSALTMLTSTALGERALIVHGPTGELLDTDGSTPISGARYDVATAIASPSGRDVLITDAGNFQTVLFSFDRDEPSYFPGRALATGEDLVVTTQNIGTQASITVSDHDGTSVTEARAPSVRAGMIAGDAVILVTVDGEIIELTTSNGTTSTVGTLEVGTVQTGHVDISGTRLIVTGDAGTAVIGEAGEVVGTFADGTPLDTGIDELATRTSSCVAMTTTPDSELVVAALDDGSIVAEAAGGSPALSSVDGCTVVTGSSSGVAVVNAQGVSERTVDGELVAVTPDATRSVSASAAGRLLLTDLTTAPPQPVASVPGTNATGSTDADAEADGDAGSDVIDLGPASRLVLFTQR